MASAAEAELGALYKCARAMVPLRQALIEMGWPQGKSSIQTDNSTADGVVNNTIVPKRHKSMDLRLHWLCCCAAQGQFRFFGIQAPTTGPITTANTSPPSTTRASVHFLWASSQWNNCSAYTPTFFKNLFINTVFLFADTRGVGI